MVEKYKTNIFFYIYGQQLRHNYERKMFGPDVGSWHKF